MVDFTNMPKRNKTYTGANGKKISIMYNEEQYMLKFPSPTTKRTALSYANSCVSEYLGCKIFESVEIPVQKVVLGTYQVKNKEKLVVACKDFATKGNTLQDFASLKNQIIDSDTNGRGTELSEIIDTINDQYAMDPHELTKYFWDVFIVDALIGNWDRHNGNWGFLYNEETDQMTLAPVYDCGSSLYPQADETVMKKVLTDKNEINSRIYNIPTSAIKQNGSRINYYEFISALKNKDCNLALKRMSKQINLDKINKIIDKTPYITDLQKDFFKTMVRERKEKILDKSLSLLKHKERDDYER